MSASDPAYPTVELQSPAVGDNTEGRKAHQGPDPGARVRSAVTGPPGLSEHQAAHLRNSDASMFMFASMGTVLAEVDVTSYRIYRDRLLADYGNPKDPVIIMLVEQLALAHLNSGQLFYKASSASSVECAAAYLAATTRLMAELRRTALALPAYREAMQRLERGLEPAESRQENITSDSELPESEHSHESSNPFGSYGQARSTRAVARSPGKVARGNAG